MHWHYHSGPYHFRVGLVCKVFPGRHPHHGLFNDVMRCAMLQAQVPSCKEPAGLRRSDGKRPDGVSLIRWSCNRCVTWDVTSADVSPCLISHHPQPLAGSATAQTESATTHKYSVLAIIHVFMPLAFRRWVLGGLR